MYGKFGGYHLQKKLINLLESREEPVFPFWSSIFAAGRWTLWGGATGRGALHFCPSMFSPPAKWARLDFNPAPAPPHTTVHWVANFLGMVSQLVGHPPLHSHSLVSSRTFRVCNPKCYGACQLSTPLMIRNLESCHWEQLVAREISSVTFPTQIRFRAWDENISRDRQVIVFCKQDFAARPQLWPQACS